MTRYGHVDHEGSPLDHINGFCALRHHRVVPATSEASRDENVPRDGDGHGNCTDTDVEEEPVVHYVLLKCGGARRKENRDEPCREKGSHKHVVMMVVAVIVIVVVVVVIYNFFTCGMRSL